MNQLGRPLYAIALTLWVGALWAIGGIAAPSLFALILDRTLAGAVAGRLFTAVAWVGIGCASYMLLFQLFEKGAQALRGPVFWILLFMLLLVVAGQFGIQPILSQLKQQALPREVMESVVRDRFATWHGVSSVLYLIQCALGGALVVLEAARR